MRAVSIETDRLAAFALNVPIELHWSSQSAYFACMTVCWYSQMWKPASIQSGYSARAARRISGISLSPGTISRTSTPRPAASTQRLQHVPGGKAVGVGQPDPAPCPGERLEVGVVKETRVRRRIGDEAHVGVPVFGVEVQHRRRRPWLRGSAARTAGPCPRPPGPPPDSRRPASPVPRAPLAAIRLPTRGRRCSPRRRARRCASGCARAATAGLSDLGPSGSDPTMDSGGGAACVPTRVGPHGRTAAFTPRAASSRKNSGSVARHPIGSYSSRASTPRAAASARASASIRPACPRAR